MTDCYSLSGGELFDRIADDSYKMSESEVIKYIRQVCEGLRYMHELSICHLDIKVTYTKAIGVIWSQSCYLVLYSTFIHLAYLENP